VGVLVVLGILLLAIVAVAVVLGRYEALACDSVSEPGWLVLVFALPFLALVLVPVSILRIWVCAGEHDFAYLLWIVVLVGSVVPLLLLIKTNPFCPS
jgi:hypothetical protein